MPDLPTGRDERAAAPRCGTSIPRRGATAALACTFALALLSASVLGGCAGPAPSVTTPRSAALQPAATAYRLGSGDRVKVTIFGQENLSGEFALDGGGNFAMPLIGEVRAGGLTTRELEGEIRDKFMGGYVLDPQVGVEVLNYRPFYILGEVKNPGSYPFVDGMATLNAVALAGGFTYRAKQGEFLLRRGDSAGVTVGGDHVIQPGDTITVQERFF
jgi:protein involved in polysaccharide export with SLBB domain